MNRTKGWLWIVPPVLGFRRPMPITGPWPEFNRPIPPELQSVAGIPRDRAVEEQAAREAPLGDWSKAHADTLHAIHTLGWAYHLPTAPHRLRIGRRAAKIPNAPATHSDPATEDAAKLTHDVKQYAAELGICAAGVAAYDPKYTFHEHASKQVGDRILICALENDFDSQQTAPSTLAEKAKLTCQAELMARMNKLQEFLIERGYQARQNRNEIVMLHYAVEAGLGQLGLNGQVLTPAAGSRCRFATLGTDAPLVLDAPRDFGVPKICDNCQICVRRCPPGAIPLKRAFHRGIEKAKINPSRCAAVVAKEHHCAVCIRVCPVQKYGLTRVIDEFEATGQILGKGSAELESYEFEGKVYGPGERPVLRQEWFEEIPFDKNAGAPKFATAVATGAATNVLTEEDDWM